MSSNWGAGFCGDWGQLSALITTKRRLAVAIAKDLKKFNFKITAGFDAEIDIHIILTIDLVVDFAEAFLI